MKRLKRLIDARRGAGKHAATLGALGLFFCSPVLAQTSSEVAKGPDEALVASGAAIVAEEVEIVATAHFAALWDDDAKVDAALSKPNALKTPTSALLARRAASLCAWLSNNRQFDKAKKVATRVAQQLDKLPKETAGPDRVDRLCWEAWLRAEVLDDKASAQQLLGEAEKLTPGDLRVVVGKRRWGG